MRRIAVAAAGIVSLVLADTAFAGEDEVIVAAEAGYAALLDDASGSPNSGRATGHGFAAGASVWLGTDGPLWVSTSLSGIGAFGGVEDRGGIEALLGLVYAFDVFKAVPYLEAEAGLIAALTGDRSVVATARFGLGVDYLFTRTMSLGLVGRVRPVGRPLGDALITGQIRWTVRLEY